MGFWDIAKSIGSGIAEQMEKRKERILRYQERYANYDDDLLIRRFRGASGDEKYAIALLLRERGITSADIENY